MKKVSSILKIILVILFLIITTSSINTVSLKVNASPDPETAVEFENNTINAGRIFGHTWGVYSWGTSPLCGVFVKTEGKFDISNLNGYYELNNLPLNHIYKLTANKYKYDKQVIYVELTTENPSVELDIILNHNSSSYNFNYTGKFSEVQEAHIR